MAAFVNAKGGELRLHGDSGGGVCARCTRFQV